MKNLIRPCDPQRLNNSRPHQIKHKREFNFLVGCQCVRYWKWRSRQTNCRSPNKIRNAAPDPFITPPTNFNLLIGTRRGELSDEGATENNSPNEIRPGVIGVQWQPRLLRGAARSKTIYFASNGGTVLIGWILMRWRRHAKMINCGGSRYVVSCRFNEAGSKLGRAGLIEFLQKFN